MTKLLGRIPAQRPGNPVLARLILPLECLDCRAEGDWICPACQRLLIPSRPTTCVICAKAADGGLCRRCQKITRLDGVIGAYPYRLTAVQRLIRTAKFGGHFDALSFAAHAWGPAIIRQIPEEGWTVTAIPLSARRQRERGFNQAAVFAQKLAALAGLPYADLLVRPKETRAQAELDAARRSANVRNAFAVRAAEQLPKSVLLVDDVITTGATLREAAVCLRRAGVQTVWAVTIAHG